MSDVEDDIIDADDIIDEDDDAEWTDLDEDEEDMAAEPPDGEWDDVYENIDHSEELVQVKSLTDNCLDRIAKNFERFNDAYLSSEDSALRRNLEFLQRAYSSQVIHSLSAKGLLKDRHLDFLINKYLKELDLRIFVKSGCSLNAIEKRIVQVGNDFTKVSFEFSHQVPEDSISEFLNTSICYLTNAEVLHIFQNCDDKTLKNISSFCTKLTELNIDYNYNVTSEGLKMLCKEPRKDKTECLIKNLSIKSISGLDSAITFLLDKMPLLEVLDYENLPTILHSMHKEDLKNNTLNSVKKYNLTKLDIPIWHHINTEENIKAEVLQVWTQVCPNIKTVNINFTTEDSLNLISRFAHLENVTVGNVYNRSSTGKRIELNNFLKSNGMKLKNLQIAGFVIFVPILIESCPNLQNLVLTDVQFQSPEKNHTKGQPSNKISLHSLSELCLMKTFFDQYAEDSVTNILLSSPDLRKLSFEDCKFENSEMNTKLAKFCENCTLQHLRFYSCDIDIALLESIILTCPSLLSLTIDSCEKITSDEAFNLHQLKDAARSFVKIVYTNSESDENSVIDDFYDYDHSDNDVDVYYDHDDEGSEDYDLDDPYLSYVDDYW